MASNKITPIETNFNEDWFDIIPPINVNHPHILTGLPIGVNTGSGPRCTVDLRERVPKIIVKPWYVFDHDDKS